MIWTLSQVALGGALGSVLRYLTVSLVGGALWPRSSSMSLG